MLDRENRRIVLRVVARADDRVHPAEPERLEVRELRLLLAVDEIPPLPDRRVAVGLLRIAEPS
jgi:hypothetical protein